MSHLYLIQVWTIRDRETTLQLALECLAGSGRVRLRVTGSSMVPAVPSGSCVVIRRAAAGEVNQGDVVLTRTPDGVRLHRLIEIRGCGADGLVITRGDNNEDCDPPLRREQLLGVLAEVESPERTNWFSRLRAAGWRVARLA